MKWLRIRCDAGGLRAKPPTGRSLVIFEPMVWTMRSHRTACPMRSPRAPGKTDIDPEWPATILDLPCAD